MSGFSLRVLKAKHGDCFILKTEECCVLIDGGPSGVYRQSLKEALESLPDNDGDPPKIDLMMVSHIDADHIDGILDLMVELEEARDEQARPLVDIRRAWHNSFSDLIASSGLEPASMASHKAGEAASLFGEFFANSLEVQDSKMVLSSVRQGRQLRHLLMKLNIPINAHFAGGTAIRESAANEWNKRDLSLELIGPTEIELNKLKKEWAKELPKILEKGKAASSDSIAKLDTSVSNLSSLVVVAKHRITGKSLLLTGDARGDLILEWLEQSDFLSADGGAHFDIIKLPHHASDHNVSEDFFKRVTADHYIASGNGKHGNPEPNTFEMLFSARPERNYKIHLTYSISEMSERSDFLEHGNDAHMKRLFSDPENKNVFAFTPAGKKSFEVQL